MDINIKYTFQIDTGGGYIQFFPNSENGTLVRTLEDDRIFARTSVEGTLQFTADEYTTLKNLADTNGYLDIKIYRQGTLEATGQLNIRGQYNDDISTLECSVNVVDDYTTILENRTSEINILNNTIAVECIANQLIGEIEYAFPILAGQIPSLLAVDYELWKFNSSPPVYTFTFTIHSDIDVYARQIREFPTFIADEILEKELGSWVFHSEDVNLGTTKLRRPWSVGLAVPLTGIDPYEANSTTVDTFATTYTSSPVYTIGNTYNVLNPITGGNENAIFAGISYENAAPNNPAWNCFIRSEYYLSKIERVDYSRFRTLQSVITALVQNADSTIQFDSNSFNYLNDNDDLKNILIANISDLKLTAGIENTDPTSELTLTMDILDNFLYIFKLKWIIENISDIKYFRIKHLSEISYSLGSNPDLTNYKSNNWTFRKNLYSYILDVFSRIKRKFISGNVDFKSTDIVFPRLIKDIELEIDLNNFYSDIQDIFDNQDKYPDGSTNGFLFASCDIIYTDNQLLDITNGDYLGNYGYNSFSHSYPPNILSLDTGSTGSVKLCKSNDLGFVKIGQKFKVSYNFTGADAVTEVYIIDGTTGAIISNNPDIYSSLNDVSLIINTESQTSKLIIETEVDNIVSFSSINLLKRVYDIRSYTGKISGEDRENGEMAISSIDENHGMYELFDSFVDVNGKNLDYTGESVRLKKLKEQEEIQAPFDNITDVDFEELIKTDLANIEPKKLSIPLNGRDNGVIIGNF